MRKNAIQQAEDLSDVQDVPKKTNNEEHFSLTQNFSIYRLNIISGGLKIVYESLPTKREVFVVVCEKTSSKWSVSLLFLFVRIEKSCFLAFTEIFLVLCRQNASRQLATSSENLVANAQFLVALATSESQFRALHHKCEKKVSPQEREQMKPLGLVQASAQK